MARPDIEQINVMVEDIPWVLDDNSGDKSEVDQEVESKFKSEVESMRAEIEALPKFIHEPGDPFTKAKAIYRGGPNPYATTTSNKKATTTRPSADISTEDSMATSESDDTAQNVDANAQRSMFEEACREFQDQLALASTRTSNSGSSGDNPPIVRTDGSDGVVARPNDRVPTFRSCHWHLFGSSFFWDTFYYTHPHV